MTLDEQKKFLETLIYAFSLKDYYSYTHSDSVSALSTYIGKELGLSDTQLDVLHWGSLVHDIGKIALPLEVLIKPGKLSTEEVALLKRHVLLGYNIMTRIDWIYPLDIITIQHHERLDGSGYPYGLNHNDIILESQIIAVADIVDAMSTDRPYRAALSNDITMEYLHENAGITLHEDACNIAIKVLSTHRQ